MKKSTITILGASSMLVLGFIFGYTTRSPHDDNKEIQSTYPPAYTVNSTTEQTHNLTIDEVVSMITENNPDTVNVTHVTKYDEYNNEILFLVKITDESLYNNYIINYNHYESNYNHISSKYRTILDKNGLNFVSFRVQALYNNQLLLESTDGVLTYDYRLQSTSEPTETPEPTVEPTEKPDTTLTLMKKNGITIKTDTDRLKYSSDINLEVKNNSGKDIIMRITDLSIDDEMADCYYRQTVKNGKKSTESLKIYDSNFYEGSKIEFTVEVMNKNYHTLFTKTVKFTVPKDEEE